MARTRAIPAIVLSLLTTLATSQQVFLQGDGLPSCAQSCAVLNQASSACAGVTSVTQAWACFCQSAYLTALKQTAATICPTECPNQSDLAAISTWYNGECGDDLGASEHQDSASAPTSSAAGNNGQQSLSTAAAAPASSNTSGASSGASSGGVSSSPPKDWWSGHYQWIVMVIVLAILLPALGVLGHWLKRRHDRRRDQRGFNTGITSRVAPMGHPDDSVSGAIGSTNAAKNGRGSPARTRDAFMPYGYGYSRSESRVNSNPASPLPEASTPEVEKQAALGVPDEQAKRKSKRVLVRERSGADSITAEKGSRF